MLVIWGDCAVVMRVLGRCSRLKLRGSRAAMVIGTTECHRRGSRTLRGNCQHQRPNQKRSNEQTHIRSLPQHESCAPAVVACPAPCAMRHACRPRHAVQPDLGAPALTGGRHRPPCQPRSEGVGRHDHAAGGGGLAHQRAVAGITLQCADRQGGGQAGAGGEKTGRRQVGPGIAQACGGLVLYRRRTAAQNSTTSAFSPRAASITRARSASTWRTKGHQAARHSPCCCISSL